ncbi:Mlp family lipoprotein [Borrelia turicatae]|uniref:Mlp family lipoprotein n=1 Tax=Borrelia turicatae TaxID=142 RepID=UPI002ED0B084
MNKYAILLMLLSTLLFYCCKPETSTKKTNHETTNELVENKEIKLKTPEDLLIEKLNDTEKSNLDFLKQALRNESKFNQFLSFDEVKIKAALEHIKTQLESCNDDQKKTFQALINVYFTTIDDNKLDQFNTEVASLCEAGG